MASVLVTSLVLCSFLRAVFAEWALVPYNSRELYDKFPGYGKSWMFFPDGNGNPQITILEGRTIESRFSSDLEEHITFHLYTRKNPDESYLLETDNITNLKLSNFDFSKETKFVTHGWRGSKDSGVGQNIKNAFLETKDCNVIVLDWKNIASNIIYIIPMMQTKDVGQFYGKFLDFLAENGGKLEDFHLIGHSLGAHISGFAGASVKNGKLGRITGLDPAMPGFQLFAGLDNKLDSTDAIFVDVIHTCAGALGYYTNLGHVDFYPNGGTPSQPGCFGVTEFIEACSHGRSWQFFVESIKSPEGFLATHCESWAKYKVKQCENSTKVPMGEATPKWAKGEYFLETEERAPFALGEFSDFISGNNV